MTDAILFEQNGPVGLVTLNRPKALNALSHEMALALEKQLLAWREDAAVAIVVIRSNSEKAFCAGGDIRAIYEAGKDDPAKNGVQSFDFYADEYRLNTLIKRFPKPYIALIDGICMGGGVGLSIHGRYRVGGDRLLFAMPETGIGFFPDVGGTYFLPRLPGMLGYYLGLTGARLKVADCLHAHIIDYYVRSEQFAPLLDDLLGATYPADEVDEVVAGILADHASAPEAAPIRAHEAEIMEAFSADNMAALMLELERGSDWAKEQAQIIRGKSPTSSLLTFRQLREGAELDFEGCMRLEYRLARYCMVNPDFYEGVRAVIVDKDHSPNWVPGRMEEVAAEEIARAFAPIGEAELALG
ncbi:MAG: enoyl-CoA hydratase/isomerase family protein [Neomegalonema sp.]|nr:enoyl-CoA hydratase/isomerase family protein [Neomegalonema sp.]